MSQCKDFAETLTVDSPQGTEQFKVVGIDRAFRGFLAAVCMH
jgi:hypothetical protein